MHMGTGVRRGHWVRVPGTGVTLELQVFLSHAVRVLETESGPL